MIAPLRKRHFRTWVIIAIVLPVAVIAAYTMAPQFPGSNLDSRNVDFPELLRSVVSPNYMFNIKKSYAEGSVLEIKRISSVNPASELVTISYSKNNSKNKTKQVLGMMGEKPACIFNLKNISPPFSVTVTDTIKHKVLAAIDF